MIYSKEQKYFLYLLNYAIFVFKYSKNNYLKTLVVSYNFDSNDYKYLDNLSIIINEELNNITNKDDIPNLTEDEAYQYFMNKYSRKSKLKALIYE